jgi:hypothetical protein
MGAGKIALGALLCALASTSAERSHVAHADANATSALVVRVSAPLQVIEGHGDFSLHAHIAGRDCRLGLAWSSDEGHVRLGAVLAAQPES